MGDLATAHKNAAEVPPQFEQLVRALVPNRTPRQERFFVAITVYQPGQIYLDESRQGQPGKGIYAVSAFVTNYENVGLLENAWMSALRAKGVEAFHGNKIRAPKPPPPYDNWTQKERDAFVVRLAEVAVDYMIVGLGCAVLEEDFFKAVPKRSYPPHLKAFLDDPFAFCLNIILGMCLEMPHATSDRLVRLTLPRPLSLIFDDRPKFVGKATTIWRWRKRQDPQGKTLATFSLAADEAVPLLQAADLLVYYVARKFIDPDTKGVAADVDRILRSRGDRIGFSRPPTERIQEFAELLLKQPVEDFSV